MSLPAYPTYKDSGTSWLGEIPSHWRVERLKNTASLISEKASSQTFPIALENIESWSGRYVPTESDFEGEGTAFIKGDILFGKLRPYLAKALLTHRGGEAVGDFHVLRPKNGMNGRYLQYQILTREFIDVIDGSTFGSKMPRASWEALAGMPIIVASADEQDAIVTFLDSETSKIDVLISEQEKLLELLTEQRQATISHAVTCGLNADAPMKDSGVEWLGAVPAHWQIAHLKRCCLLITDGAHISPETVGGVYNFVSTKDIVNDDIDFDGSLLTSEPNYAYLVKTGCRPLVGDVLFSKDGTIGRTVVVRDGREFVVASSLIIIRANQALLDPDYLNYLCKSDIVSRQVESFVKGAGLPRLSIQNLLKVIGVFPPLEEQRAIVAFLGEELDKLKVLNAEAERAIALLKERRGALISAAVTGKIDVREHPSALAAAA